MYNKINIFSSLKNIVNNKPKTIFPIISNNIAFGIYLYKPNFYICRLWQTKTIFNKPLTIQYKSSNFIGAIDYIINDNYIYINYIDGISNYNYNLFKFNDYTLTNNNYVQDNLLQIIENKAKQNNITKITMDVHSNLERYHYEFYDKGFELTNKCSNIKCLNIKCSNIKCSKDNIKCSNIKCSKDNIKCPNIKCSIEKKIVI